MPATITTTNPSAFVCIKFSLHLPLFNIPGLLALVLWVGLNCALCISRDFCLLIIFFPQQLLRIDIFDEDLAMFFMMCLVRYLSEHHLVIRLHY